MYAYPVVEKTYRLLEIIKEHVLLPKFLFVLPSLRFLLKLLILRLTPKYMLSKYRAEILGKQESLADSVLDLGVSFEYYLVVAIQGFFPC